MPKIILSILRKHKNNLNSNIKTPPLRLLIIMISLKNIKLQISIQSKHNLKVNMIMSSNKLVMYLPSRKLILIKSKVNPKISLIN